MKINLRAALIVVFMWTFNGVILCSCSNGSNKKTDEGPIKKNELSQPTKPPSAFNDSLWVSSPAAVFFHPDSMQQEKFRQTSSKNVYESTTHESFFQMRNCRIVLKKYWPQIYILEAHNIRYLVFTKSDQRTTVIDLNNQGNLYGLFLFRSDKEPELVDMMNIETALGFYFK